MNLKPNYEVTGLEIKEKEAIWLLLKECIKLHKNSTEVRLNTIRRCYSTTRMMKIKKNLSLRLLTVLFRLLRKLGVRLKFMVTGEKGLTGPKGVSLLPIMKWISFSRS